MMFETAVRNGFQWRECSPSPDQMWLQGTCAVSVSNSTRQAGCEANCPVEEYATRHRLKSCYLEKIQ